jgi:hypothetical protein
LSKNGDDDDAKTTTTTTMTTTTTTTMDGTSEAIAAIVIPTRLGIVFGWGGGAGVGFGVLWRNSS